jgi:exopolyphosphatase/guanosine-5'-triphosphate,3'-diphosphate pyrophosphatase
MDPATRRIWQEIPRISEGLAAGGPFKEAPLKRAWRALDGFAEVTAREGPLRVLAGATMAARLASDGGEFVQEASRRYGWECVVLEGHEEARLSALGALAGLQEPPASAVVFDVGGRSTEFAVISGGRPLEVRSLPVGVVGLKEAYIASDPPAPEELSALEARVAEALLEAPAPAPGGPAGGGPEGAAAGAPEGAAAGGTGGAAGAPELIGTAGTVTTLAAMLLKLDSYLPDSVHGRRIPRASIESLYRELASEAQPRRLARPCLHPMRADVIVGGLALVLGVIDRYGAPGVTVSDWGLLEGLWLASSGAVGLRP